MCQHCQLESLMLARHLQGLTIIAPVILKLRTWGSNRGNQMLIRATRYKQWLTSRVGNSSHNLYSQAVLFTWIVLREMPSRGSLRTISAPPNTTGTILYRWDLLTNSWGFQIVTLCLWQFSSVFRWLVLCTQSPPLIQWCSSSVLLCWEKDTKTIKGIKQTGPRIVSQLWLTEVTRRNSFQLHRTHLKSVILFWCATARHSLPTSQSLQLRTRETALSKPVHLMERKI